MITFTKVNLKKVRKVLEAGWSKKTTFPKYRESWSGKKKSQGQCYVTARTIQMVFGGKIIKGINYNHYWNILPSGDKVDFTSDQFKKGDGFKPAEELDGKIVKRKYKSINPRLKKYLDAVEKPLRQFKKELEKNR